jgi:hypothetical protein
MELKKRKKCYVMPPRAFEIAGCDCGNQNTQWSEYEGHLWCAKCEKDFIPAHGGIFDGPIPVGTCRILGIRFDEIDLETGEVFMATYTLQGEKEE